MKKCPSLKRKILGNETEQNFLPTRNLKNFKKEKEKERWGKGVKKKRKQLL